MSLVLVCDFGSTNFRAALVDQQGRVLHDATLPNETGPAADEVDPLGWWRALLALVTTLAASAGPAFDTVSGVAICGVTRTQVFLDARGKVLRPALTWRDRRSAAWAERLVGLAPKGWAEAGQLNAFHPAARVAWLTQNEPVHGAALHAVVDPKDYLNFCLTGIIASDFVSSARILAAGRLWPDGGDLFTAGLLPRTLLSIPFLQPTEQIGPVQAGLPGELARLAGVPVFCMANDTWSTAAGMGALREGVAYNISGTTEVFGVIGKQPVSAPGLLSVDWGPGLQQIGGPSQSGADTLSWFFDMLSRSGEATHFDTVLSQPRQATPALFLPFLSGERTPYWEPMLRAAWFGLNREHCAADLAYAVLEGVAFLNRTVLERAETATGERVQEILFGGGGSANAIWAQIKADVTGRSVLVGEAEQPGLLGGAIVAWTGLGVFPSMGEAQQNLVRIARAYEPDPQRNCRYDEIFDIWTAAVAAARPISERLAVFRWS